MNKFNVSFLIFFFFSSLLLAQKDNKKVLFEIAEKHYVEFELKKKSLEQIADSIHIPKRIKLSNDKEAVLVDFIDGLPYYSATHNLQGRRTTGIENLQSQTQGTDLKGNNILVGVWDEGFVRNTHVEFGTRVTNKGGADFSNHATHVAGTILAEGLNPDAKGMLPQASVHAYHAFENDLGSMAVAAAEGLMISNHSYGLVLGWQLDDGIWKWFGEAETIDGRFGYYSSQSKSIDDIAYNAPYYTIIRSAGNDRSDIGDGTRPPDGPFDCVGPAGVAKNVITVGAITGFDEYQGPQSVVMSSFSSWGPTDDGRIKPDVVGDGVAVFSTSSSGDESYTSLQGTSMAAPNVTGSIASLQQYYRESADTFMTSAALKSLVIHTAREAGVSPGPDYAFGWGVVNVVDAHSILKNRNDFDTLLIENQLANGSQHEYQIFSDGRLPIAATIAWTDVPGTPGAEGSTDIKLVNDLDIRLIDNEGIEIKPWTLNPISPSLNAIKADNNRDNVEKIEFGSPEPGLYRLRVTHKNSLASGIQSYGLTFTGSSINGAENDIYWVSGSGAPGDTNWALASGGAPDANIQPENKTWVFDNNGPLANNDIITLNGSQQIKNLIWASDADATIDLNGDTLFIQHEILVLNTNLKIRNGVLVINGLDNESVSLGFNGIDGCRVVLSNELPVELQGDLRLSSLTIDSEVYIESQDFELNELSILNGAQVTINDSDLSITGLLSIQSADISGSGNNWVFTNSEISFDQNMLMNNDTAQFFEDNSLQGTVSFAKADINDVLNLNGIFESDSLNIHLGADLIIGAGGSITINSNLIVEGFPTQRTSIKGASETTPAVMVLTFRKLICTDFLDLENLNIQTESVINVGVNSMLINVNGVTSVLCEDVIFPDFQITSFCANSVINIVNNSLGEIEEFTWDFGNGQFVEGINDVRDPLLVYDNPGLYTIRLTIKKNIQELQFEKEIEIVQNDISPITVIEFEEDLIASLFVSQYTWYRNGTPISGEQERTLTPMESGSYRVSYTIASSDCSNRISVPYDFELITSTEQVSPETHKEISFYPNPLSDILTVSGILPQDQITIFDLSGKMLINRQFDQKLIEGKIAVGHFPEGMFILRLARNSKVYIYKVIKK